MHKNREAARSCRRKKKDYIGLLEKRVIDLESQNQKVPLTPHSTPFLNSALCFPYYVSIILIICMYNRAVRARKPHMAHCLGFLAPRPVSKFTFHFDLCETEIFESRKLKTFSEMHLFIKSN